MRNGHAASNMTNIEATLREFGADLDTFHRFDEEVPELLPYASLLSARSAGDRELDALLGVYEWHASPLIFLVDASGIRDSTDIMNLRRRLAMRGDAPYLGVVHPGRIAVYPITLHGGRPREIRMPDAASSYTLFSHLGNHRPGAEFHRRRWISEVVLRLLNDSISGLIALPGVTQDDAISLVGRALFTRFLGDRQLLPEHMGGRDASLIAELFDNPERAEATSIWLDHTFNGEFLPIRESLFRELPRAGFDTLGNILRRAEGGQLSFKWSESWANLDFAHIPVGVLSQSYELFLREHIPEKQRREGGYYTPQPLAQLMVRAAFHGLQTDGISATARILDPAAGAGVFLLTAFRELVAERWRRDKVRPDTSTLRQILYDQITGFDINEAALRFAALGLYLLCIELDPNPEPVEKLKFRDLRDCSVLHKVGDEGSPGSLGGGVGQQHDRRYDLVIGNPPWASSTKLPDWASVDDMVRRIAQGRASVDITERLLPNQVLDLPFVWRAMEWAKPGGQIAFALHARLLFQQHEGMREARNALLRTLDISGILNGAELRHTNVWPTVDAPFCLLFGRNRLPRPGSDFPFVSPHLEDHLNRTGALRIDTRSAEVVSAEKIISRPETLKALFRGGILDLEILQRVDSSMLPDLRRYWQERFGGSGRKLAAAGNGYQRLRASSRVRINGDGQPGVRADYLHGLPELTEDAMRSLLVQRTDLGEFRLERIHDRRDPRIFRGPLLLVHKSPPAGAGRIRVAVFDDDVVFSETYYGYSAHGDPHGKQLVRYLALVIGSKPAFWHYLVTSGEFGVEREVVEKATIDSVPILPFEKLDAEALKTAETLFDTVAARDDEDAWQDVDAWVARLYGFRQPDLQVIDDTLNFNLPFAENRKAAQARPGPELIRAFCRALHEDLDPWIRRDGRVVNVIPHHLDLTSPWHVVQVETSASAERVHRHSHDWTRVLDAADQLAATEVLYNDVESGRVWLARLAQSRYWSLSQARLVARRIVWDHLDVLLNSEDV
jgi:hypothetical protein